MRLRFSLIQRGREREKKKKKINGGQGEVKRRPCQEESDTSVLYLTAEAEEDRSRAEMQSSVIIGRWGRDSGDDREGAAAVTRTNGG